MRTIVAIDVGGTQLRAAAYQHEQLEPLTHNRIETKAKEPNAFGRLIDLIEGIWPKNMKVDAIGVSSPGPVDPHNGIVIMTPNIKEWRDFPITAKLSEHF